MSNFLKFVFTNVANAFLETAIPDILAPKILSHNFLLIFSRPLIIIFPLIILLLLSLVRRLQKVSDLQLADHGEDPKAKGICRPRAGFDDALEHIPYVN